MLSWLKSLLNIALGGVADLWRKVVSLVTTVWNNLWGYVQDLYRSVVQIANDIRQLSESFAHWIAATYGHFVQWTENTFNDVIKWADSKIASIEHDISSVINWASAQLDTLGHYAEHLVDNAKSWVLSSIWAPLYNAVTGAIGWIEREGAYVYDLITHPDKLVTLLIAYIWQSWLSLFKTYAKPLIAYMLSQWRNFIPDIVAILEDIISSQL